MSFTYGGAPGSVTRDGVRFLLSDTVSATAQLTDEEIAYLLTTWTTVNAAARAGAEIIAGKYARSADESKKVGDLSLSTSYSSRAAEYRSLAASLAAQHARKTAPAPWAHADSLLSTKDRTAGENSDFSMGQFDYASNGPAVEEE